MNMRAPMQGATLQERCMNALRELDVHQPLTEQEQALLERIEQTDDPMLWLEEETDHETAQALWQKLLSQQNQKIQTAALCSSLRTLKAVATFPENGYI